MSNNNTNSTPPNPADFVPAEEAFDESAGNPDIVISFDTCEEVATFIWNPDPYITIPPFSNTPAIRMAHSGVPRAGYSNDILQVITGTQDQASDYIVGLFVAAILVLAFFGVWIMLLIFLKCLGRRRVGWLSGHRQELPAKPEEDVHAEGDDLKLQEEEEEENNGSQTEGFAQAVLETDEKEEEEEDETPQEAAIMMVNPQEDQGENPPQEQEENQDPEEAKPEDENEKEAAAAQEIDDTKSDATPPPPATAEEWDVMYKKKIKQQRWMKCIVIFSCIMVITMAAMMATRGIESLRGSLNYGKSTIDYAAYLLEGGTEVVIFLSAFLKQFKSDMSILLNETNQICPNVLPLLCDDLTDVGTCNTTEVFGDDFAEAFEDLVQVFYQDWELTDTLDRLAVDLQGVQTTATNATKQLSTIDWVFYIAVIFDVLVGLLALAMIVHLLFPRMPWILKCLQNRCLFPIFLVFVLFSFIFCIAFLIASLALADTCADNPDERILDIANYFLGDKEPYINEVVQMWLGRCDVPPPSMTRDEETLNAITDMMDRFAVVVNAANDELVNVCGTENPNFFTDVIGTLSGYVCASVGIIWQLKEAFQCSTWLPLYYNAVYNAMCYSGTDGVWAIAATQFFVAFFAGVILTCRCVFFQLQIEGDGDVIDSAKNIDDDDMGDDNGDDGKEDVEQDQPKDSELVAANVYGDAPLDPAKSDEVST